MFLPLGDDVDTRTLPVVGLVLVAINLLVFCAMVGLAIDHVPQKRMKGAKPHGGVVAAIEGFERAPQTRGVMFRYGLAPKDLENEHYLGVLTHMFIHGGLIHLLGNMIVLWAFVGTLEHTMGAWKFLVCYLLWGVLAGLAHATMHWGSEVPLVGASGAIAGVIGAYWVAFGARTRIRTLIWIIRPKVYMIPAGLFVAFWIFTQIKGISDSPGRAAGIAWYAHLGGFLAGAATMLILRGRTARQLVTSRQGDMVFVENAARRIQDHQEDESPTSAVCPYCQGEVTAETCLTPNLARCPNASCGRLVLLDRPLAAKVSSEECSVG